MTLYYIVYLIILLTIAIYYIRSFIIKYLILSVDKTFMYLILLRLIPTQIIR